MSLKETCAKCNHNLEIHYEKFCPKCDTHLLTKQKVVVDLFKLMYHMEAMGFMSKRAYWEYVRDDHRVTNDVYVDMYLGTSDNEEINRYHEYVQNMLGLEPDDSFTAYISR